MNDPASSNVLLENALFCAEHGLPVFLVHSIVDGRCTCGDPECERPGKHPRTKNGLKDAILDPTQIRDCFAKWPNSNVGIAVPGGIVVIDVDARNDGMVTFGQLQEKFGPNIFETVTVRSGGGGLHLYFRVNGYNPGNTTGIVGPGIDSKSVGGYVIAPRSLHFSGNQYEWVEGHSFDDRGLAELPSCIADLFKAKKNGKTESHDHHDHTTNAEEKIPHGQRNLRLTQYAGALRRQNLGFEAILAALLALNTMQCDPPLSDHEVERIAKSVSGYKQAEEEKEKDLGFIESLPVFLKRMESRPPPKPLVNNLIFETDVELSHGQPRDGKSLAELEMALAATTGTPAFGLERFSTPEPVPVGYFTEEDGEDWNSIRFKALLAGRGMTEPPANLHVSICHGAFLDDPRHQYYFLQQITDLKLKYVSIDPLRAFTCCSDKGPGDFQPFASFVRKLVRETKCTVRMDAHDTKPVAGKPDDRKRAQRASGGGIFSIANHILSFERIDATQSLVVPNGYKLWKNPSPFKFKLIVRGDPPVLMKLEGIELSGDENDDLATQENVLEFLKANPGLSGNKVAEGCRKNKQAVLSVLERLLVLGKVDCTPKGQAKLWFLKA